MPGTAWPCLPAGTAHGLGRLVEDFGDRSGCGRRAASGGGAGRGVRRAPRKVSGTHRQVRGAQLRHAESMAEHRGDS
eukprot:scaffold25055_cov106-Isochrysis_galbana.AAC.2